MPRGDVMGLMKALKFIAMPKAYDEVLAAGRKRRQTPETVIEEPFQVEVNERRTRSICYRMTQARFPRIWTALSSINCRSMKHSSGHSIPGGLSSNNATLFLSGALAPVKPI